MATKHTNHVRATVWTPTVKMDFTSTRLGAVTHIFGTLTPEQRTKALAECAEIDKRMAERERRLKNPSVVLLYTAPRAFCDTLLDALGLVHVERTVPGEPRFVHAPSPNGTLYVALDEPPQWVRDMNLRTITQDEAEALVFTFIDAQKDKP